MLSTESGILIDVKFMQYANAQSLMFLIEFGIFINLEQ